VPASLSRITLFQDPRRPLKKYLQKGHRFRKCSTPMALWGKIIKMKQKKDCETKKQEILIVKGQ
jgi:hypothetical protein